MGLQLPDDGSILSGIAIVKIEEALFVNIADRRSENESIHLCLKNITNSFLQS